MKNPKMKDKFKIWKWRLAVPFLSLLSALISIIGRRWLLAFGQAFGLIFWKCSSQNRERTISHLSKCFPKLPEKEIYRIGRKCFDNLATGMFEMLILHRWNCEYIRSLIVNFEEMERLIKDTKNKPGSVLITGHVGNWELLAASYARHGGQMHVVGKRMKEEDFDSFLTNIRGASGLSVLYSDSSPKQMLGALKKGESIGILPDQDITEIDGIFVDFFGIKAYTPSAPAKLAMSARTKIYIITLVREGEKFRLLLDGPIMPKKCKGKEEREKEIERLTSEWSLSLENMIRQYPSQWVWMHRRWRNTPERLKWRRNEANRIAAGNSGKEKTGENKNGKNDINKIEINKPAPENDNREGIEHVS
jgi:KDO2-lipid IV(A) lauroyltransferase